MLRIDCYQLDTCQRCFGRLNGSVRTALFCINELFHMFFDNRFARWALSGPKAWLVLILSVFVVFMLVYRALVDPSPDPNTYVLPNAPLDGKVVDVIQGAGEKASSSTDDALVSTDPLQHMGTIAAAPQLIDHIIKPGETLEKIFNRFGLSRHDMYSILEADEEYLVLEPLLAGNTLSFELDQEGKLKSLSRRINPSKSISFVRHENGGFSYQENILPINYSQAALHGEIAGSFYQSAKKLGLSDANIVVIRDLLKTRIDFRKDLRAGDGFDVVVETGDVNGEPVGRMQLEAVQLVVRGASYRIFLHSDGRFYDENGNGLTPALLRWPTKVHYRISSPFNNKRRHPITGRLAPHNGTDIAAPKGTKVLATGDGVVTRVAYQKYAGKYLDVDNLGPYSSRFLHLSKVLVKKGQHVKRGQVIALSGNTGRTTGAHLHYELHRDGKPINPMTSEIPTLQEIPDAKMHEFKQHVKQWVSMMNNSPD